MKKQNSEKIAIIALTRGYEGNLSKYSDLIKRNNLIFKNIQLSSSYDLKIILFHEGNISDKDQNYIINNTNGQIYFVDVHEVFNIYPGIDGYKIMCKFQMYYLWDYVSDYDYVIRIDEDIFIEKFDNEIIEKMKNKNIDFCFSKLSYESHIPTNNTLPNFIKEIYNLKNTKFYNHMFPYTNFYITKTNIWQQSSIKNKLNKIATFPDQEEFRWGDLPVLGSFINIENFKSKRMGGLMYYHSSHNILVRNNIFSYVFEYLHYKRFINMYPNIFKILKNTLKLFRS